ncbi:MAG: YfcC family protein, partial [Tissierellia bacterium]|nr:YfcC family protein [Tissierellia bacterium]
MKKRKKFALPSSITTLLIITAVIAILTYFIPSGEYQYLNDQPVAGSYATVPSNPQGLWNILAAPIEGFKEAIEIILFVLVLGGTLGVLFDTKAIDAGLGKVVTSLKGKEKIMLPVILIICSIGGTTYGMAEETIAFYPIIMPILLAAGYDVITGIMVIFLGAGIGVAGGLINPFSVGIASNLAGISIADGLFVRFILYMAYLIFGLIFVMRYAGKVKEDPSKSIVYDIKNEVEAPFNKISQDDSVVFTKKRKAVLSIFGIMFFIMIVSIIPWNDKFNITIFQNFNEWIHALPVIGPIIGNVPALGDWYFKEMTILFFIGA